MSRVENSTALTHPNSLARLWAPLLEGACRSIAVAAELCGTTLFDDGVERPEVGWRSPLQAAFAATSPHVDWALCSELDRAIIARELGA
jgi:hypothetical protein